MPAKCYARLVLASLAAIAAATANAAQWQTHGPDAAHAADLHAANAAFIAQTQSGTATLTALARLRAHHRDHGVRATLLYAAAGLPQDAEASLTGLDAQTGTATARLAIAQNYYASGNHAATERVLLDMPTPLPPATEQRRVSLLSRALLLQKRYDEAALPLAAAEQLGTLTDLDRYNLGVAWLGAGADDRGAGELNTLGRYAGDDKQRSALADQANLTLAYWLLNHQRAEQARQVLWRLPLTSPLARKGMLALGWAEFLPTESEQPLLNFDKPVCVQESPDLWRDAAPLHKVPRNRCRVPEVERKPGTLTTTPGYADAENKNARAAAVWQAAIVGADPRDPVVAEAMIALPYALTQAGALAQAQRAYERAVQRLSAAERSLAQAPAAAQTNSNTLRFTADARLQRLQDSLDQLRNHVALRVAGLLALPQNRYASGVKDIINSLRSNAPPGKTLAAPTPLQRGQLMLALAALRGSDSLNANTQPRVEQLHNRIQRIDTRIEQLQAAITIQRQAGWVAQRAQQRQRIQLYLRRAALAFADINRDTAVEK